MRNRNLCGISLICTVLVMCGTAWSKPKPKNTPPAPPADPTEYPINGAMFSLAGQAGLPSYLKCNQHMLGGVDGLHGGEARTVDSDFFSKNFVLDLVFDFKPEDDFHPGFIGIGANEHDGGWLVDSIRSELQSPKRGGSANVVYHREHVKGHVGDFKTNGPHLFRLAKTGDAVTMSITRNFKGKYRADFLTTIPNFKQTTPYLNRLNSSLFFGGEALFLAIRLEVDGKVIDPGPSPKTLAEVPDNVGWVKFAPGTSLPGWFDGATGVIIGKEGLEFDAKVLLTREADFLTKDFTFDVVYHLHPENKKQLIVGIGENGRSDGNWILNSLCSRLHSPFHDCIATVTFHDFVNEPRFAKLGKDHAGPNLFRLQKHGDTLMMAISADYKDKFVPDFVAVIPSLKWQTPYLTDHNSHLFVGDHGYVDQMRLIVDGQPLSIAPAAIASAKPSPAASTAHSSPVATAQPAKNLQVTPPATPPAATPPPLPTAAAIGVENFIGLTGPRLPDFFQRYYGLKFAKDGLILNGGTHIHSRAADFINKNFTFDVIFHFAGERDWLVIGLGADERSGNWIHKSIACRIPTPTDGRPVHISVDGQHDMQLGKYGSSPGPHLLRMQKRGQSLTFALCGNYKPGATPDFIKTLPDLFSLAPGIDAKNSMLFIDDGAVIEKVRLVVEGQSIESNDVAFDIPAKIVEGQLLRRQIVKSAGTKRFSAGEGSPKGLAVSSAGELTWTPGHDQVGLSQFKINISDKGQNTVQGVDIEVVGAEDARAVGGNLAKVDSLYRLPLETNKQKIVQGIGGASLLLMDGDSLRRLGSDGLTVLQTSKLPRTYGWIAERSGYFVAMSDESKSLDFIDKTTMKIIRSLQMDYFRRLDLCLHPTQPICYVSVSRAWGGRGGGFINSVLIVDEKSGDVHELERFVGNFLQVSPDGSRLYAAYHDVYKQGEELLINPERIDVVPVFGTIDILIVYDITDPHRPILMAAKNDAGGNGQGLMLSPDGRRVSYLSFVGYPLYSNNIAAWDPDDLTKRPVTYMAKVNNADCKHVAFHRFLPIAAAATKDGAICFQREAGDVEPKRLDLRTPTGEMTVNDLIFSPDGRNLILVCEFQGDHFLRRLKLNFNAAESARLKEPPPSPPAKPAGAPPLHRDTNPKA